GKLHLDGVCVPRGKRGGFGGDTIALLPQLRLALRKLLALPVELRLCGGERVLGLGERPAALVQLALRRFDGTVALDRRLLDRTTPGLELLRPFRGSRLGLCNRRF